jgi:MFS family permease
LPTGQALQKRQQRQGSSAFFHGNASVIAISSAIQSLGGFFGIYLPKYFVQIGGDPLTLGLFSSASSLIQFFTLSIGGFLADYYGRRKAISHSQDHM